MSKNTFTTSEILKILDLNRNTFQVWMDKGFVRADIQKSTKQGEPNLFSRDNLYQIHLFSVLLQNGIDRRVANDVLKDVLDLTFKNVGPEPEQLKYATCKRHRIPGGKLGMGTSWNLHKAPPTVALGESDDFDIAFTVNLLARKNEVDKLIKEQGLE
jgi:hypothetical protein